MSPVSDLESARLLVIWIFRDVYLTARCVLACESPAHVTIKVYGQWKVISKFLQIEAIGTKQDYRTVELITA